MNPRTLITDENAQDLAFVGESELNTFFGTVVITGTETDTSVIQTFDQYFPGRGLLTAGSGILVTTGTNFVQITVTGTTTGDFLTPGAHEVIDSLVHTLSESSTGEITKNVQGAVVSIDYRTTPVVGTLIRSTVVNRNSNNQVASVVERQHDASGAIIQTLTTTLNRTDGKITTVTLVEA